MNTGARSLVQPCMKTIIDRADSRGRENHGWLDSKHTFSFSDYYNPDRMNFGALRVLNDDIVTPGAGFGMHPHRNMEVISIPLKGSLLHGDSLENSHSITRGQIQVMSAGTGIYHSEFNGSKTEDLEFLQIWVIPQTLGTSPEYNDYDITPLLEKNEISTFIAPDSPISLLQEAWFSLANLDKGVTREYKLRGKGTGVYVFVIEGEVTIEGTTLYRRDGMGISDVSSFNVAAGHNSEVLLIEVPL